MKKNLELCVLNSFIVSAFATSVIFTPLSICKNNAFAQVYASENESDKKLEELLSRKEKLETRNELRIYLDYGYDLYEAERWDDLIMLNKHALELYAGGEKKDLWYVYHNIGGAYFNKGDYEEALTWMDEALNAAIQGRYCINIALIKYGKALIFYKLKDYKSALENIEESLRINFNYSINSPEGWYAKALILKDYSSTIKEGNKKQEMLDSALESVKKSISGYKYELNKFYYDEEKKTFPNADESFIIGLKEAEQLKKELEDILASMKVINFRVFDFSFDSKSFKINYIKDIDNQ